MLPRPQTLCPREPKWIRLLATTFLILSGSCAQEKSNLEAISHQVQAEALTETETAQASLPELPTAPNAPNGLPSDLWADIHWLPAEVVGINGTPPGQQPPLAHWIFSQPFAEHDSCRSVERGLASGYGIEWEQPPQSFVFYGTANFAQIEECAKVFMKEMGGTAEIEGQVLELRMDDSLSRVSFGQRGDQLVAVVDDDGKLGGFSDARAGRLLENEALVRLLGDIRPAEMPWSASTLDMTQVALGVSSLGYTMALGTAGQRWEFRFMFSSAAEAGRAKEAAGLFLKEAEAFLGLSLDAQVHDDGDALMASVDMTEFLSLAASEPEKMKALQDELKSFVAERPGPKAE